MIAVEYYPVGIGKHIVCIYDRRNTAAIYKRLSGNPRTPYFTEREDHNQNNY